MILMMITLNFLTENLRQRTNTLFFIVFFHSNLYRYLPNTEMVYPFRYFDARVGNCTAMKQSAASVWANLYIYMILNTYETEEHAI